ncbi:MAG: DNA polymerase III subunit delta', partial [Polyangiaceae bacterium]|nr:DNA polymerase III subunit delta' [Polyangiaceae bacterium]
KEMAAMAFAQALVCTEGGTSGGISGGTSGNALGCGVCSACRRAVTMGDGVPAVPMHPDVIFLERGLYPHEMIGRLRDEAQDLSVDQVRTVVLERAAFPPHEGRARVYIVRRAEELSISAGNALLKTLEEPGSSTHFILLVARPGKLLSTIRSRTLRIRFAPLHDDVLRKILEQRGIRPEETDRVIPLCGGSASVALELADEGASRDRDAFVKQAFDALASTDSSASLSLAESLGKDKPLLKLHLEALAIRFAQRARERVMRGDIAARLDAKRHAIVLSALAGLERNASTALTVENMMLRMRAETG